MEFYQQLEHNQVQSYSLNFLLAEFEEIKELDRDLKIIATKISSPTFGTQDFKTRAYYKNISTCFIPFSKNDSNE